MLDELDLVPLYLFFPEGHPLLTTSTAAAAAADAATASLVSELRAFGSRFRGRACLLLHSAENRLSLEDFAFPESQPWPLLGASPYYDYAVPKYAFRGPMTADRMGAWLDEFFAGTLKASIKSAAPPTEAWSPGEVRRVVGTTLLAEVVASSVGADVLLCLHAPSYPIERLGHTLRRLATALAPLGSAIRVATMDTMQNAFEPETLPEIDRYHVGPLILLFTSPPGDPRPSPSPNPHLHPDSRPYPHPSDRHRARQAAATAASFAPSTWSRPASCARYSPT